MTRDTDAIATITNQREPPLHCIASDDNKDDYDYDYDDDNDNDNEDDNEDENDDYHNRNKHNIYNDILGQFVNSNMCVCVELPRDAKQHFVGVCGLFVCFFLVFSFFVFLFGF